MEIKDNKRKGFVVISDVLFEKYAKEIFKTITPYHIESDAFNKEVKLYGVCDLFDEIELGQEIPRYVVVMMQKDEDFSVHSVKKYEDTNKTKIKNLENKLKSKITELQNSDNAFCSMRNEKKTLKTQVEQLQFELEKQFKDLSEENRALKYKIDNIISERNSYLRSLNHLLRMRDGR